MITTKFILLGALLLLLLNLAVGARCPAGYYLSDNVERPCYDCWSGDYCPGDDKSYPCPEGTAAPRHGQSVCDVCPSKRSNQGRYFCVLSDTPQESQDVDPNKYNFAVDVERPYFFTPMYFSDFGGYNGDIAQFTFVDVDPKTSRSVVVYASRTTGKPGPDNYEFTTSGPNATLIIPRRDGENYVPLYFNIVPVEQKQAQFNGKGYYWLVKDYQLTEDTTVINAGTDFARWVYVSGRFIIDKVPANSIVNFTVSVEGMRFHDTDLQFRLFYTSLKSIQYPNVNNAQIAVTSKKASVSHANLIARVTEGGPFYISLATTTIWDARITVKVTVTREMEFSLKH